MIGRRRGLHCLYRHRDDPAVPADQRQAALEHEQPIARHISVGHLKAITGTIGQKAGATFVQQRGDMRAVLSRSTFDDRQQRAVRQPRQRLQAQVAGTAFGKCSGQSDRLTLGRSFAARKGVDPAKRLVAHQNLAVASQHDRFGVQRAPVAIDEPPLGQDRQVMPLLLADAGQSTSNSVLRSLSR